MSQSSDKSPSANFQNSTPVKQFRSPFYSPRNGADFSGSSPMKNNFGWRNNPRHNSKRFYGHNDHQRFNFSPRGARRGGGHFRGGHHRGAQRNEAADISLYVNPSMLSDPWKELTEMLETRVQNRPSVSSVENTPNTSESKDDTLEELTEESVLISDSSGEISNQTTEESDCKAPNEGPI